MSFSAGLSARLQIPSAHFLIKKDARGEWRWSLVAANNEKIASSGEGYRSKSSCEEAVQRIKDYAPSAPLREG